MKTLPAAVVAVLMFCLALAAGGCMQALAYTTAQFAPKPKSKPVTELPKEKCVLVYVDSEYPLTYDPIKSMLTEELNRMLLEHKLAGTVVARDRLLDVLATCPDPKISKQEIAAKTGADLLLYVSIEKFQLRENESSPLWTGKLQATIRWIDVKGIKKLWPTDQMEYPVPIIELPSSDDTSPSYGNVVAKALSIKTADRITKLFYEHELPKGSEKNPKMNMEESVDH